MHQMYTISIANRIRWKQVCEALSANGLEMYVGLFQREALDGGKLALLDEGLVYTNCTFLNKSVVLWTRHKFV